MIRPVLVLKATQYVRVSPRRFLLVAILSLTGCGDPKPLHPGDETLDQFTARIENHRRPNVAEIDAIERKLSVLPCIGSLMKWRREYAYALSNRQVDEHVIDFKLTEVGHQAAGRHVVAPIMATMNDDSLAKLARGSFDVPTQQMKLAFCGDNFPRD